MVTTAAVRQSLLRLGRQPLSSELLTGKAFRVTTFPG
jgi:hypothetical protein